MVSLSVPKSILTNESFKNSAISQFLQYSRKNLTRPGQCKKIFPTHFKYLFVKEF